MESGDSPYTQTCAGLGLQVRQLPQQLMLREGVGSLLMSEWSFPQFLSVEIPPMYSNTPVIILEAILIRLEKFNLGGVKSAVEEHGL